MRREPGRQRPRWRPRPRRHSDAPPVVIPSWRRARKWDGSQPRDADTVEDGAHFVREMVLPVVVDPDLPVSELVVAAPGAFEVEGLPGVVSDGVADRGSGAPRLPGGEH